MRLLLIRHGQASFGASDYDRLSPLGQRQSRLLGEYFRRIGYTPAAWYCGSLRRQSDTLAGIGEGSGVRPEPIIASAFNEYDHEALLRAYLPAAMRELGVADAAALYADPARFQQAFECVMHHWHRNTDTDVALESPTAFQERVRTGLSQLAECHAGQPVAVVTSGGPIAFALRQVLGVSLETTLDMNWSIYNASLTELAWRHGRWSLRGFNGVAHLQTGEPGLLSYR